ncbi:hypothetical protein [Flavobacterium caeni]|uniref:Uncharacterized protein n=1 Tax=Flavobacterium caeni TaxID=490189 RepID=A0A1G5E334_9FLAO|nr:hypothetical protein [Flavobacterium caeni]SCY21372.1 hypothetical protein SAMN02927903_00923 [Flavobacterium caeni]
MRTFVAYLLFLLCASCGSDSLEVNRPADKDWNNNASLKNKLMRMAQYETAADNIVDGTSGFAILCPYAVVANDQWVQVDDPSAYSQIRAIFAASANNTDIVEIQFPVTVVFPDYSQQAVSSQTQFDAVKALAHPSVELSCLAFAYPLQIKTYDTVSQTAQTVTLASKPALYQFVKTQRTTVLVAPNYPVTVFDPNGQPIQVTNTAGLEALIDDFTVDCLNAVHQNPSTFEEILTQGTWFVSYFFREADLTADYAGYDFAFQTNGNATAISASANVNGNWVSYDDEGVRKVQFTFSGSALDELDESWTVTAFDPNQIEMVYESGGSGTRYFTLTRN